MRRFSKRHGAPVFFPVRKVGAGRARPVFAYLLLVCGFFFLASCGSSPEVPPHLAARERTAPTPVPEMAYVHCAKGWKGSLPIPFQLDSRLSLSQRNGVRAAMATWERATGCHLFRMEGVHSVQLEQFSSVDPLSFGFNGVFLDPLFHTRPGNGSENLALAYMLTREGDRQRIGRAAVSMNTQSFVFEDVTFFWGRWFRNLMDIQSVLTHELGHVLGLDHVPEGIDPNSVMRASIPVGAHATWRELSLGDVWRIRQIYGDCR